MRNTMDFRLVLLVGVLVGGLSLNLLAATPAEESMISKLMVDGKFLGAISATRRLMMVEPENGRFWFELSRCLDRLQRYSEALVAFRKAAFLNPALKQNPNWSGSLSRKPKKCLGRPSSPTFPRNNR